MSTKIYTEDYTEKSFVVRGDTRDHKDSIKALGGKWQSNFTDRDTGERFGAWLFWTAKRKEVDAWVRGGCKEVKGSPGTSEQGDRSFSSSGGGDSKRLARIEKMLTALLDAQGISVQDPASVMNGEVILEDDEPAPPKRRLLAGHK